ncbi:Smf protein DNA processing chain A [gut metagenome]|uniref:Smf protein DNA processing chain A n=1 Tax=gut metagenome TaxID=749906 RepID=J9FZJ4_9ZZZZ
MNETLYALALTRIKGLGLQSILQLYQHYGSATSIYENRKELTGRAKVAMAEWDEALRRAETEIDFCEQKRIAILLLNSPNYPQRLKECPDPPIALFYRGNADLNARHIISVVGTRKITEYGKEICQDFITSLKAMDAEILIISGLAYGVDIHAHRACLENALPTVGVLAHGLDQIYPSLHRSTALEMLEHGGLLTEYMSMTNPDKGNFVQRNRIVAGLSDATVVIESAEKGGALITACLANDYNRDVLAFPGRVNDKYSEGCNKLIKENRATMITCASDMMKALNWEQQLASRHPIQRELFPMLLPEEEKICQILQGKDAMGINQIVVASNLPFQEVSSTLFELELKGVVKSMIGGQYKLIN